MISFDCSTCKRTFQVPDNNAGKKTKCPQCQALLIVPAQADPWEGPRPSPKTETVRNGERQRNDKPSVIDESWYAVPKMAEKASSRNNSNLSTSQGGGDSSVSDPEKPHSRTTIVAIAGGWVAALALGVGAGFVLGHRSGKAANAIEARESAQKAAEAEKRAIASTAEQVQLKVRFDDMERERDKFRKSGMEAIETATKLKEELYAAAQAKAGQDEQQKQVEKSRVDAKKRTEADQAPSQESLRAILKQLEDEQTASDLFLSPQAKVKRDNSHGELTKATHASIMRALGSGEVDGKKLPGAFSDNPRLRSEYLKRKDKTVLALGRMYLMRLWPPDYQGPEDRRHELGQAFRLTELAVVQSLLPESDLSKFSKTEQLQIVEMLAFFGEVWIFEGLPYGTSGYEALKRLAK